MRLNASRPALGAFPIHPLLLGLAWWLDEYLSSLLHPLAVVRSGLLIGAVVLALLGIAWATTRNRSAAGLLTSGVVLALLAKPLVDDLALLWSTSPSAAVLLFVLGVVAVALAGRILWRARLRLRWVSFTRRANAGTALLLLVVAVGGLFRGAPSALWGDLFPASDHGAGAASSTTSRPDVFVILLDAYPGAATLQRVYGYDNAGFLAALDQRGLAVSTASHSNYWFTSLTLMSMFDMHLLQDIPDVHDVLTGQRSPLPIWRQRLNDNTAFGVLRGAGYQTVAIGPGWEDVSLRGADRYVDAGQANDFEVNLLRSTYAGDILNLVAPTYFEGSKRDRVDDNLDAAAQVAASRGSQPTFVYCHVPAPHPPVAITADGKTIDWRSVDAFFGITLDQMGLSVDAYRSQFLGQLEYLNGRVLATIDAIKQATDNQAVIILMSDHGPGNPSDPLDEASIDLRARFVNLFAAYTPGKSNLFPQDITPVNVMTRLFNGYLWTDLPLQPDDSYASTVFGTDESFQHLRLVPPGEIAP